MNKRKTPWGIIVVLVGLVGAIGVSKMMDVQPAVGSIEEMQAREEARMKEKAAEMAKSEPKALGTGREAPSTTEVASLVRREKKEENLVALKQKKVGKSPTAMIMNPVVKQTKDRPNEAQPFTRWWEDDNGRTKTGK